MLITVFVAVMMEISVAVCPGAEMVVVKYESTSRVVVNGGKTEMIVLTWVRVSGDGVKVSRGKVIVLAGGVLRYVLTTTDGMAVEICTSVVVIGTGSIVVVRI